MSQSTHMLCHSLTGCWTPLSMMVITSVMAVVLPWNTRLKNSCPRAVAEAGLLQCPALYIWNQNRLATNTGAGAGIQFSNLTPAWDPFKLPPITIDEVPIEPPR